MLIVAEQIIGKPVFVKRLREELAAEIVAIHSSDKEVTAYVIVKGEGTVLSVPLDSLRFPVPAAKYLKLLSVDHGNKLAVLRILRECFGGDHKSIMNNINYHLPHVFKEKQLSDYELEMVATHLRDQGCEVVSV